MFTSGRALLFGSCLFALLLVSCGKKEGTPPASKEQVKEQAAVAPSQAAPARSIFARGASSLHRTR